MCVVLVFVNSVMIAKLHFVRGTIGFKLIIFLQVLAVCGKSACSFGSTTNFVKKGPKIVKLLEETFIHLCELRPVTMAYRVTMMQPVTCIMTNLSPHCTVLAQRITSGTVHSGSFKVGGIQKYPTTSKWN